jgi:hypothetical protein
MDPERSGILRAEFGVNWRLWSWFKHQFTATSLSAIGAVTLAAAGYIVHLNSRVGELGVQVVVLETQVVPVLAARRDETDNKIEIENLKQRVTRIESSWDVATVEAAGKPQRRER